MTPLLFVVQIPPGRLPGCGESIETEAGYSRRPGPTVVRVVCSYPLPAVAYLPEYHAAPLAGGEVRWDAPARATWGKGPG